MRRNIGAALGMGWVMAPTRELRRHQFGNVVLSRYPIRDHAQLDLSWKTCEPRNASASRSTSATAGTLQVYNVHLGTALLERRYQAPRLAAWVHDRRVPGPKIVLGDFNEWGAAWSTDVLAERLQERRPLSRTCGGGARTRASSRCCTSTTSTSTATSRSAVSSFRARAWRSSPRITCRSSPTCAAAADSAGVCT